MPCFKCQQRFPISEGTCYYSYGKPEPIEYPIIKRNLKHHRRRNLKLRGIIKTYTGKEWKEKLYATKGICLACKKEVGIYKLTMDHIVPISKAKPGTIYTINDIQPLCKECNEKKGDKIN